jgi:hypothetical protein
MSGIEEFQRKLLPREKLEEEAQQWLKKYRGAQIILRYWAKEWEYGYVDRFTVDNSLAQLDGTVQLTGTCEKHGEYPVFYRNLLSGLVERDFIRKDKSPGLNTFYSLTEKGMKYANPLHLPEEKKHVIDESVSKLKKMKVKEDKVAIIEQVLIGISEDVSMKELEEECKRLESSFEKTA